MKDKPAYKKPWFWILFPFFWPFLTIYAFWETDWKKQNKWIGTALTAFVFLGLVIPITQESVNNSQRTVRTTLQPSSTNNDSARETNHIPGLVAVDVYGNLEDQGLMCDGPNTGASGEYITWTCSQESSTYSYTVEITGTDTDEITSVQATALNYGTQSTDALARDFLGFVASTPYQGASPAEARNWVQQHVSETASTTFGAVQLETVANSPSVRVLNISPSTS